MSAPIRKEVAESVYDLLEWVRKRPTMYLDNSPTIQKLAVLIAAYDAGLGHVGFVLRDGADFHRFHDWVAKRLGFFESTSGWANMIREKSTSDEEAFTMFYVLLDEFRKGTG
jgi:hypothetical protein